MKSFIRLLCAQAILLTCTGLWAQQDQTPPADTTTAAPDNTKINQRDRNQAEPTADQQSNAKSDRELTRQVRRAIVKDKSLSTYAHNIKIITQDGKVTLRGPVKTEEEKQMIEKIALAVAGANNVDNQLEVNNK